MIVDGLGSSEAGGQLTHVSAGAERDDRARSRSAPGNARAVGRPRPRARARRRRARLAGQERAASPSATSATRPRPRATYPVIDGVRYAVPGDRARLRADGIVELHGRDSVTINSGGEKIFAEEVEAAIKAHPAVYDCVVAGRPSERWGNEVVAVVQLRAGREPSTATTCSPRPSDHIARYKLPKAFVFVDEVVRSPSRQGRLPLGASRSPPADTPCGLVFALVTAASPRGRDGRGAPGRALDLLGADPAAGRRCRRATTRSPRSGRCSTPSHRGTTS